MKKVIALTTAALALGAMPLPADPIESAEQRDARMAWWREARFGMFVHWGLYSGLAGEWQGRKVGDSGGMEWLQQRVGADTWSYAREAAPKFLPKENFAREWAALAREAGCQYVVFTTKHHDGFALHDSALTQYDAGDFLNRDLVREICDALRAEGLKIGYYHSVIDWHHPQYDFAPSKQLPYPTEGRKLAVAPRNHSRYVDFLHGQVDELVSNYGKIDVLWWDFSAQDRQGQEAWRAFDLMDAVRAKQPHIIQNNRLFRLPEAGFSGMGTASITMRMDPRYGDFVTPEQHIPATGMPGVDWETCMTMNTTWGYSKYDKAWKSSAVLIRNLIDIASKGGNYLLNIGPLGDGSVPEESVERAKDIGAWMRVNAEAIRGTTASPLEKTPFDGRITSKGAIRYAHLFARPDSGVLSLPFPVAKATLLAGGQELSVKPAAGGVEITLPETLPDAVATVIRLE